MKHRHYDAAYRAHYNTSFTPDKRAEQYCAGFDADIAKLTEKGARAETIARYEALWLRWMAAKGRCLSAMITGPSLGVWQRQLTNNAVYSFNHYVLPVLKKGAA